MGIVSINIREFVKRAGELTLNFIPARLGFHCISLLIKVNAPSIPQWGGGGAGGGEVGCGGFQMTGALWYDFKLFTAIN